MRNFTRKGYGRIYVANAEDCLRVEGIMESMDEFEYQYLPQGFIAPFSAYPELVYTGKFDGLDLNKFTAECFRQGIYIWCCDNGTQEYL